MIQEIVFLTGDKRKQDRVEQLFFAFNNNFSIYEDGQFMRVTAVEIDDQPEFTKYTFTLEPPTRLRQPTESDL